MKARKKLFNYSKIYDHNGSERLFINAMKESIIYHEKNNDFYKSFLKSRAFSPQNIKNMADIYSIPSIPVDIFKNHEIKSIEDEQVHLHATSSGTSGQKSQVFLDKASIKLGTKMITKSMKYHGLISMIPTNYILLGYEPHENNKMGNVKILDGMTRFAPPVNKAFALKTIGDTYQVDYLGVIQALKKYHKQKLPVRIFGFPSHLYMLLKCLKTMNIKPMQLHPKSIVLTGGGWKGYKAQAIDKNELRTLVNEMLGIPIENCRDFYSAVEHSVAYPECKYHHMHVPIWSRVVIRDIKTLAPVGYNEPGFLSFISPLVGSMPLSSIIMNDIAILKEGRSCHCGINTPYFEIIDRVGQGKTCAMKAAELIGGV